MTWQTDRAKVRAPRRDQLVVRAGTPCYACKHPRSSHSMFILQGRCKASDCTCWHFEPLCACGHLLCEHTWGTPPYPWECCRCHCAHFGADMTGTRDWQPQLFLDGPTGPGTASAGP